MKKVFGFFVFITFIFSGFLSLNINNIKTIDFNVTKEATCGSEFISVTNSTEFMDAANANENICVENDIDFSDIPADQSIEDYSGIIDGQYYTLSNRNIKTEYIDEDFNYFFINFSGRIKDIKFNNFPFLFKYFEGENDSSNPDIENIVFQNIDIENIYFENAVAYTSLFIAQGLNIYAKNISFLNINFINNVFKEYSSDVNNYYFGFFGGDISDSNLNEIYFLNINFSNNLFDFLYTDDSQTEKANNLFRFGFFLARSNGTFLNDIFVNELIFENNVFSSYRLYFGLFIGAFASNSIDNISLSRIYTTNVMFENNSFYFDETNDTTYFSTFLANFNPSSGKTLIFDSIVIEKVLGDFESNKFYDWESNEEISNVYFGEISGEPPVSSELVNLNNVYYINDSGTGDYEEYYSYIIESELTLDFWINQVHFDESEYWNLNILFDKDLNISENVNDEDEIYGFPLFTIFNYVNINIDNSGDTYLFKISYVPSESATSASFNSIFGESESFDVVDPNVYNFDSGISTEVPIEYLSDYYWFDLEKSNDYEINILIGDINSTEEKTLYTESPDINNEIEFQLDHTNLSYSDNSTFEYDGKDQYQLLLSNPDDFYTTVNDVDGNSYTFSNQNSSIDTIPDNIVEQNINNYYQIDLNNTNHTIKYLDTDKTIKNADVSISENSILQNTDDLSPMQPVYINIYNEYGTDENGNYLEFTLSFKEDFFIIDPFNSDFMYGELFTITSKFNEFDNSNDPNQDGIDNQNSITFDNFEIDDSSDGNNGFILTYKQYLKSDVPKSKLNQYYSIEVNSECNLYYYYNLSGDSVRNETPIVLDWGSDLTNTSPIEPYDTTQNLQLSINISYNLEENTLYFDLTNSLFDYFVFYNVNLILYSQSEQININLSSVKPTAEVKLNSELPYNLESNPTSTINDYYSIGIDSEKSMIFYITENGNLASQNFDTLIFEQNLQPSSPINNSVIIIGDLNNIDSGSNGSDLKPINPEPEPPQPTQQKSNNVYWFLLVIFILFVLLLIATFFIRKYNR